MSTDQVFPVGVPAAEGDVVDRERFIDELTTRLRERQSVVMAGPRRTGKTSVALEVLRRLRRDEHAMVAVVDVLGVSSTRGLAQKITAACLENLSASARAMRYTRTDLRTLLRRPEIRAKLYDMELTLAFQGGDASSDEDLLDEALELPERMATQAGKRFVVLFDEFQVIEGIGPSGVLARMRSTFQHQQRTSFLFLGSHTGTMAQLFGARNQPFFRYATMLELPPVPEDAWREYLTRRFGGLGVEVDDAALAALLDQTGGHPYDTMRVAYEARLLLTPQMHLTAAVVLAACERAQTQLATVFDAEVDALGTRGRLVLARIAREEPLYADAPSKGSVTAAIKSLIGAGLIRRLGRGQYEIVEPMLAGYMR